MPEEKTNVCAAVFEGNETARKIWERGNVCNIADDIEDGRTPVIKTYKTGFPSLDALDGGLYGGLKKGLYVLGAVSSLGKTTLCHQIADQIAESGNFIMYFSMEQGKQALVLKSLARNSYRNWLKGTAKRPLMANQILLRNFADEWDIEALRLASGEYRKYRSNVLIFDKGEDMSGITVEYIVKTVSQFIAATGIHPVVFVDYLQLLGCAKGFMNDKQRVDEVIKLLHVLSEEQEVPVVAISSLNRDNYTEPVSMSSFKESGGIEYGSDCLFGLQYSGMDRKSGETERTRQQRIKDLLEVVEKKLYGGEPVDIQLNCLKERMGRRFTVHFKYHMSYDYFVETV